MVKFAVKEVTYQISPVDQSATTVPLPGLAIVFSVSWICWMEMVPDVVTFGPVIVIAGTSWFDTVDWNTRDVEDPVGTVPLSTA